MSIRKAAGAAAVASPFIAAFVVVAVKEGWPGVVSLSFQVLIALAFTGIVIWGVREITR